MNINEIKTQLGFQSLSLVRQFDANKVEQPWVSHWDNDRRIRLAMHNEVLAKITADKSFAGLALKKEVVQPKDATKPTYTRYVVITPTNIVANF